MDPHAELRAFLDEHDISLRAAGKALGVSDVAVLYWSRDRRPRGAHRVAIERWTGGRVPASAWETEAEQAAMQVEPYEPPADDSDAA